jgi:PPK2 family polyphosphate:nucleotide phosphotransferase
MCHDPRMTSTRERFLARPGGVPILASVDPGQDWGLSKSKGQAALAEELPRLTELHDRLWAEERRSVLAVLQAMDTGGKDGTIKYVFGAMNPQGSHLASFKAPTPEEREHHFLWRIRNQLPAPGKVGIFNRSHYEDIVAVRVRQLAPQDVWEPRYAEIEAFEQELVAGGTTVVKFWLHISKEEQRQRLLARLDDPTKRWKFREGDLDDRALWDDFQQAWEDVIQRCSGAAPWYVIPADRKWHRNLAVARIMVETLQELDPRYPTPDLDVAALRKRLEEDR